MYLSEYEGSHVGGLPEAGVQEVGEGHGGEGLQALWRVQGEVEALAAPPLIGYCTGTNRLQQGVKVEMSTTVDSRFGGQRTRVKQGNLIKKIIPCRER